MPTFPMLMCLWRWKKLNSPPLPLLFYLPLYHSSPLFLFQFRAFNFFPWSTFTSFKIENVEASSNNIYLYLYNFIVDITTILELQGHGQFYCRYKDYIRTLGAWTILLWVKGPLQNFTFQISVSSCSEAGYSADYSLFKEEASPGR